MFRGKAYESDKAVAMYESMKVKRYRSAFTTEQINYLEKQFKKCPYIGSATRKEVANVLSIPERAIKIWFQNRRMKEKKEANNKEYNLNLQNNLINNVEFAKDSLNNEHSLQSANDRQCSLEITTTKHVDKTNCTNYNDVATFCNQIIIDNLKKEMIVSDKPNKFKNDGRTNNIKQDDERRTFLSEKACLSKYGLNKVYNNRNFVKYLEQNKKGVAKSKGLTKTDTSSTLPRYQDLPEDLSARNLANMMIPQGQPENINLNSAYIPYCNTQNVCFSAGNVIWKPVNVMPFVSQNTLPLTVPERQSSLINQKNPQKCECNCNCQSGKKLNYEQGNIVPQPQYVIAIPYNNNLNLLR